MGGGSEKCLFCSQSQFCMLLTCCVTLGKWLHLSGPNRPICITEIVLPKSISKLRHRTAITPPGLHPLQAPLHSPRQSQEGGHADVGREEVHSTRRSTLTGLPSSHLQTLGPNFPLNRARPPQVPPVGPPAAKNQLSSLPKEGRRRQKEKKPPRGRI